MERLYGAFNLAAKAMGKTTQEMNKALEMGQVTAKELLPKLIPLMDEMANKNGALTKQLETAQTAQMRFNTAAQEGADTIWQGGMSEGMKDLFETLSKLLKEYTPQLRSFGDFIGRLFRTVARGLEFIAPLLGVVLDNMDLLFGAVMISKMAFMLTMFKKLASAARLFSIAAATSWAVAFAPVVAIVGTITAGLALIEDYLADWNDSKLSGLEISQGYQEVGGKKIGIVKSGEKYYSTGAEIGSDKHRNIVASVRADEKKAAITQNNTFQVSDIETYNSIQSKLLAGASAPMSN